MSEKEEDNIFPLSRARRVPPLTSLTNLTKLTNLTNYSDVYVDRVPRELWAIFKIIAQTKGIKVRELLIQVLGDYVNSHASEVYNQVNITNIKVEGDVNIYQTIISEEISQTCKAITEGKKRDAPKAFLDELKDSLLKTLKQNPNISSKVAEDVKAALSLLREKRQ